MNLEQRAYSAIHVKAMDDGKRRFSGWATTPATDRVMDTIDPMGVKFANPLVLLHGHRHDMPIGRVNFRNPTKKGVEFDAEIPEVSEEYGSLKDRVDTAWGELKYGLVRAVSVGFRAIKYNHKDNGGIEFNEVEVYELSTVAIPALPEAIITSVKSMSPLSHDALNLIRRYDMAQADGSVPLIRRESTELKLEGGAIALVKRSTS